MSYIVIADVKKLIGLTGEDIEWDAHLTKLATAVSDAIDYECGRSFVVKTEDETRYVDADGGTVLRIDDLRTLSSVALDTSLDSTFATALTENTDFYLKPFNKSPKLWLSLNPNGTYDRWPNQRRAVKIVGLWGYDSVIPDAVKVACEMIVARLYKRKDTAFATMIASSTFDGFEVHRGMDPDE
ncbi:MAG: hypothetical protein FJZ95_02670, partial [Chloroflexi bacterium]|nr:hypothetical protein [Chloroflexota bacterium]